MTKLYKHNCDECTYLGSFKGKDLYHCMQRGVMPTLIARHSSIDSDYTSGIILAGIDPFISVAYDRAVNTGLIIEK